MLKRPNKKDDPNYPWEFPDTYLGLLEEYCDSLEKALDKACKDCEALDESLAYETSSDNFKVDDWQTRKKRYLEESEKEC